ncbi:CIC11C00000002437 [Sungouiella intermedia]|uniref:CIC11C00000002437 n=1 Tax=Sungouiella intermedia TaxID=45354 RepID=A0A1L0D0A6_9ASCO|nr:CIC11C00000002437 [[Candida] intermedia]
MKFGKTFVSHQIPEWSPYYMNYKHLKKVIKTIDTFINYHSFNALELPELISSVLSQFFFELDRDIEKVSEFFNSKFSEYQRRSARIIHVVGYANGRITHQVDTTDELDEIVSILLELRTIYRNLKWFGDLNHKGFIKILKKLDKKLLYLTTLANDQLHHDNPDQKDLPVINLPNNNKETYLTTRVDALPFANESELLSALDTINSILNQLGEQQLELENYLEEVEAKQGTLDNVTANVNTLKIGNKRKYSFDKESLEGFYDLIYQNRADELLAKLDSLDARSKLLKLLLSLLNRATLTDSLECIDMLFDYLVEFSKSCDPPASPLFDSDDISGRNFFHQHVVSLGKKQLIKEQQLVTPGESSEINRLYGNKSGPDGIQLTPVRVEGLVHILSKMDNYPEYQDMLMGRDSYFRTPLHYSAQYGIKDVAKIIFEYLLKWKLVEPLTPIDLVLLWGDQEGLTPLHLAIIGKHPKTCLNLLAFSQTMLSCPNLVLLATRLKCDEIVKSLVESRLVDVNFTDSEDNNETALYIASKLNLKELVNYLLLRGADTELGENVFGWTPIFAAAAEGYKEIVEELKTFGAMYNLVDDSGWLPMEHASLRGHLDVADLLKPLDDNLLLYDIDDPSKNTPRVANALSRSNSAVTSPFLNPTSEEMLLSTSSIDKLPELNRSAVNEVYRQFKQLDNGSQTSVNLPSSPNGNGDALSMTPRNPSRSRSPVNRRKMKPIKSFGHRYLTKEEQLILITLGTTDLRDETKPIDLSKISMSKSFFTELDTALSLVITCRHKVTKVVIETPVIVDLPLEDQHGSATDPISFKLINGLQSSEVFVTFDIVPTYQYPASTLSSKNKEKILGRGVAMLNNAYTKVGNNLRSLHNTITIPIIEQASLDVLGTLNFEYLCVTPFVHPQMSITRSDTYWKQLVSTRVIGHRGLGKNMNNRKSLQLGENTVESFIAAASLGASYVEFDVQLTKDFVPVIYHDFLVAESGVDIPMHSLTAEQFLGLSEQEGSQKHSSIFKYDKVNGNANVSKNFAMDDELLGKYNRPRLMSSYPSAPNFSSHIEDEELDREFQDQMFRRMKLTKTWKEKGFKGNARGLSVASNFVTLKELFKRLPKNVGFNMELKYPMLDEAEQESMGEVAFDMNFYVDTILKTVYDENTTGRDILFSSFHPDICLLLSLKQPTMPILFLTEAGTQYMADIRASSLQNAIRFAKKWNLLGIVSAAKTLVKTPRLAQVVKSSGLVCVTYGVENNSPDLCKIQMKAGVDAVIADSVLAVREGMRKEEGKEEIAI